MASANGAEQQSRALPTAKAVVFESLEHQHSFEARVQPASTRLEAGACLGAGVWPFDWLRTGLFFARNSLGLSKGSTRPDLFASTPKRGQAPQLRGARPLLGAVVVEA